MPPPVNALAYGMRDIRLTPYNASDVLGTGVDLPAARTLSFSDTEDFEELRGDDKVQASKGKGSVVNWDLESGGISIDAYVVLSGGTVTSTGTTPATKKTLAKKGTTVRPYFKAEGQALTDGPGDVHLVLYRCKATGNIEGEFADGAFWLTSASGIALADATDNLYDIVFNETAIVIP